LGKSGLRAYFVGLPNEFEWAHKTELAAVTESCLWVERAEFLPPSDDLAVIVLNLDEKSNALSQTWEMLRYKFPHSDLIALSSNDSAVLAMRCLRSGFADYLTQPVSPDELILCLLRSHLLQETRKVPSSPGLAAALNQISNCSSPESLRIRTAQLVVNLVGAERGIWEDTRSENTPSGEVAFEFEHSQNGKLVLEGVSKPISKQLKAEVLLVTKHAEVVLMNLRQVEKLKQQTFIDDLTGLYNSRYLRFALDSSALAFDQKKQSFGLLFIDVDHFKQINDRYGHLVGSEFLAALGKIVKNSVRHGDVVFRYGGDEFVVLLRKTNLGASMEIAERLRERIQKRSFVIRGAPLSVTVSVGLSVFPDHTKKTDRLVQLADEAMYAAKQLRNKVCIANPLAAKARPPRRPQPEL
jgi:diguanylate cyclase (GGDEF)-like protein